MNWRSTLMAVSVVLLGAAARSEAQNWSNSGGNSGRNGLTSELGPDAATVAWTAPRPSIISWQPVIDGDTVFVVRQTGFPPAGEPNGSPVFAYDLTTGAQRWRADVPFAPGDWTTWIAGARDGRVYVSRSGNGASVLAPLIALDAQSGSVLWTSAERIDAGAYDGVVFAENGDLIVASFRNIKRIRAIDGSTAWTATRTCSVSGNCGGAIFGGAVYVADAVPGGNAIRKFDLATGAFRYNGPVMTGFTIQNTPFTGPDGSIYLSRTQSNAVTDFFYAFGDSGTAITQRWRVPAGYSTASEFGASADGAVYSIGPGNVLRKLRAADGVILDETPPLPADFSQPRIAVNASGRVFFSNGGFSNGRFYSLNPDLSERWSIGVPNANIGSPAIGRDGTLVIAGLDAIRAYRTPRAACIADVDDGTGRGLPDGAVTLEDLLYYLVLYDSGAIAADVDDGSGSGVPDRAVTLEDLLYYLQRYDAGC